MIQGYPHDLGNAHIIWSTETILVVETLDTIGGNHITEFARGQFPPIEKTDTETQEMHFTLLCVTLGPLCCFKDFSLEETNYQPKMELSSEFSGQRCRFRFWFWVILTSPWRYHRWWSGVGRKAKSLLQVGELWWTTSVSNGVKAHFPYKRCHL